MANATHQLECDGSTYNMIEGEQWMDIETGEIVTFKNLMS